jgi:hypothetical protein
MIESEIRTAVVVYLGTRELPMPEHPTNTCDPLTGNWADRLADPGDLQKRLAHAGFSVDIRNGHYGRPKGFVKRFVARLLDFVIQAIGYQGLRLAPFFLLHATGQVSPSKVPAPVPKSQPAVEEPTNALV